MKIEIKSIYGSPLYSGEHESLSDAVVAAIKGGANLIGANLSYANLRSANLIGADLSYANLRSADLSGANLRGADLTGAYLSGANLSYADLSYADLKAARLDTGETMEQYLKNIVPALCTAGGKSLEDVAKAWDCHNWDNCPMATAFGIHRDEDAPPLLRPRVRQFIQLFDARLIPNPITGAEACAK